jgi:hypothetical protein
MPPKQELEHENLTKLAARCQELADDPSAGSAAAEKARGLKQEWVSLIRAATPPLSEAKELKEIKAQEQSLKARMVTFLASTL